MSAGVLSWNIDTPTPHASDDVRKVATVERDGLSNPSAGPDLLVASQRLLALRVVVDDRGRVAVRRGIHAPRLVDLLGAQRRQLRYPSADVGPLGVEILRLQDGVEDPEVRRRVAPGARRPLPPVLVVRDVAVDEVVHEVTGAQDRKST